MKSDAAQGAAPRSAGATAAAHVLEAREGAGLAALGVVIGPDMEEVGEAARQLDPKTRRVRAGRAARHGRCGQGGAPGTKDVDGHVLVLYGDTPLFRPRR